MTEIIFHLPVLVFALVRKTLVLKITLGFPITTQSQLFRSQLLDFIFISPTETLPQ